MPPGTSLRAAFGELRGGAEPMTAQSRTAPALPLRPASTTLTVAIPYEPHGFNEVYRNYTGGGGYFVANNVFNRLVVVDVFGDGGIRPDLAERWEVLDGGATYRFHLRRAR